MNLLKINKEYISTNNLVEKRKKIYNYYICMRKFIIEDSSYYLNKIKYLNI